KWICCPLRGPPPPSHASRPAVPVFDAGGVADRVSSDESRGSSCGEQRFARADAAEADRNSGCDEIAFTQANARIGRVDKIASIREIGAVVRASRVFA